MSYPNSDSHSEHYEGTPTTSEPANSNRRDFLRSVAALSSVLALPPFIRSSAAQDAAIPSPATVPATPKQIQIARGVVFLDHNGNGQRDADEPGLPGVRVSNGREIVVTDAEGRYALPVEDDAIIFVQKPAGYRVPLDARNLPRFYYIHKPAGSPTDFKYPGIAPTGPLPASIDFPLVAQKEPEQFRVLLFGDPQPRNLQEVDYLARDIVQELTGVEAAFGVSLGDNAFDNLTILEPLNDVTARLGVPWHSVLGNHDMNFEAPDDSLSSETFKRLYGPTYYSFDYGPVHFLVLDDVIWLGPNTERKGGNYTGGFGERQLQWIKNDLASVPRERLTVLLMHIPLSTPSDLPAANPAAAVPRFREDDKRALLALFQDRPNTLSVSAHTHLQYHAFVGREEGWNGAQPHHHFNCGTTSGSWWSGAPDETGVPHSTMRDGTPNGYAFIECDRDKYSIRWQVARRSADYQMNVHTPSLIEADKAPQTPVLINLFNGSERSRIEMRLTTEGAWTPLSRKVDNDPGYVALKAVEEKIPSFKPGGGKPPYRALPAIEATPHLWQANLPALKPGVHELQIRATDMWGKSHLERRLLRVV